MPKALLDFLGYKFFFWSNKNNELPHIHVSKGAPTENATKFWLIKDGIQMAHNNGQIPVSDLKKITRYILSNRADIIAAWFDFFHCNIKNAARKLNGQKNKPLAYEAGGLKVANYVYYTNIIS